MPSSSESGSSNDGGVTPDRVRRSVLVVDDELRIAQALVRVLGAAGFDVEIAVDGGQAVEAVKNRAFDVILSDINMPGMSGIALLRAVRTQDLDVPVILMTGEPTLETAMEAISLGAMQYFTKPMNNVEVVKAVERASTLHRLTKIKRDALKLIGASAVEAGDRAGLQAGFDRALETMWMAFQPIVDTHTHLLFGYEALMRTGEPTLPDPSAVLGAAERLDRLQDLGRRVRALSATAFETAPSHALLFVNLHTVDLLDPDLFAAEAPLTKMAHRVVLEVTERAPLDGVNDLVSRMARLRTMGFRIAIDDLGAGYAGLSSFVSVQPEFVKLDMSLVRDVHRSTIRQRVIGSLTGLCTELGLRVIAEGVESEEECEAVSRLSCDLLQGFYFARPGPPFPGIL